SLHVAAQLKAGVVWVNCTNLFDAACGFGGYRESGYGREGGREGWLEYLEPVWFKQAPPVRATPLAIDQPLDKSVDFAAPPIDRTVKLYIGGSRLGRTPGTASKCAARMAACLVKRRWVIAKTFATPSKRRAKLKLGARPPRTIVRRFFSISRKISRNAATKLRCASRPSSERNKRKQK